MSFWDFMHLHPLQGALVIGGMLGTVSFGMFVMDNVVANLVRGKIATTALKESKEDGNK